MITVFIMAIYLYIVCIRDINSDNIIMAKTVHLLRKNHSEYTEYNQLRINSVNIHLNFKIYIVTRFGPVFTHWLITIILYIDVIFESF